MRCSAVASLLAYFFSRRQARSRFYRALLAGISNALHSRIAALLRERYWPLASDDAIIAVWFHRLRQNEAEE
jgi:hypothetical protein